MRSSVAGWLLPAGRVVAAVPKTCFFAIAIPITMKTATVMASASKRPAADFREPQKKPASEEGWPGLPKDTAFSRQRLKAENHQKRWRMPMVMPVRSRAPLVLSSTLPALPLTLVWSTPK